MISRYRIFVATALCSVGLATNVFADIVMLCSATTTSRALADALISAELRIQRCDIGGLARLRASENPQSSVWIAPHLGKCQSDVVKAITSHLQAGGRLLVIGEPAFQEV